MCGGALLLMISRALLLIHCRALFLVFYRALLVFVLCARTLVSCTAILNFHSVAHFLHLGLALFFLHSTTLLFVGSTALLLISRNSLVLCATVFLLGHVTSIHRERNQYCSEASKQDKKVTADVIHPLFKVDKK